MFVALLKRLARDREGTSAVEMGIILAVIVLAMLGALQALASSTNSMWNDVSSKSNAAVTGATS